MLAGETQGKDKGYSNAQLVLASLAFGSCMIFWAIYNSYVPLILDYELSNLENITLSATVVSTLTGFIMTIDNFFGLIFQPIFGRKSDYTQSRFGKRMPFLIVGVPVCAILFVLMPLAVHLGGIVGIVSLMAVVILFNFVMSTWRAPCVAIMPDMVPVEYQSDGNAVVNMIGAVSQIIATLSATILTLMGFGEALDNGEYLSVFVFGAVVCMLFLIILLTCVRWHDNRGERIEVVEDTSKRESLRNLNLPREAKISMAFMMLALFFISGSSDGFSTFFTLYAQYMLGIGSTVATQVRTFATLGGVLFAVPAGIVGRKIGRKRAITIGIIGVVLSHAGMFALPYIVGSANVMIPLSVLNFLYALFFILININTLPIMLAIGGPERFGAFTGYYYMATFSAAVVCPTLIGFLIGISGTYNALQLFGLVTMFLAMIALQRVKHGDVIEGEHGDAIEGEN